MKDHKILKRNMIINLGHLEDECGKGISKGKDVSREFL